MSDDWLKTSGNSEHGKSPEADEPPIALDDMGIPILDEVVFVEEDYSFDNELTFNSIPEPSVEIPTKDDSSYLDSGFELPEDPELMKEHLSRLALESETEQDAAPDLPAETAADKPPADSGIQYERLREQLRSQVKQDLEAMICSMASAVVEKLSVDLEQQIQAELRHSLDHHLDQAIDQAIDDISETKSNEE